MAFSFFSRLRSESLPAIEFHHVFFNIGRFKCDSAHFVNLELISKRASRKLCYCCGGSQRMHGKFSTFFVVPLHSNGTLFAFYSSKGQRPGVKAISFMMEISPLRLLHKSRNFPRLLYVVRILCKLPQAISIDQLIWSFTTFWMELNQYRHYAIEAVHGLELYVTSPN